MQRSRRSKRATPKVALKALPAARPKTKKRGRASTSGSKGSEVIQIDDEGPSQKSQLNGDGYDREKEGRDYKKRIREMEKLATNPDLETKFKLVSTMELDKLVGDVMRYMLFKAGQNQSFPVARDKLTALVTKKYPKKHGLGQAVVAKAQASFAKVMGMEMRELTKNSPTGVAGQKFYILRSLLPQRFRDALEVRTGKEGREEKGFLLIVLMMLSLSGDEMTEDKLWEHLNLLGLEKGTRHKVFGDPALVLGKFVRQRYVQRVPKKSDSGRVYMYLPGENAADEVDQASLSQAISKILQKGHSIEEVIELD